MKIYHKKLNSLEELKREKHVLLYAKKHTASEDLFSPGQIMPKSASAPSGNTTNVMAIIGDLLTSKSATSMGLTLGVPLVKMLGLKASKSVLKPLVREVVGGYIKWKLIHFGIKIVRGAVQAKKESKRPRV